ncbi:hypothetical protein AB205_0165520, partial [Aquarana catesbeiana]
MYKQLRPLIYISLSSPRNKAEFFFPPQKHYKGHLIRISQLTLIPCNIRDVPFLKHVLMFHVEIF